MDKNKSEKLKEILNQTISQEEIEQKLKKEIKNAAKEKAEQKIKADADAKKFEETKKETKNLEEQKIKKDNTKIEIKEEPLLNTNKKEKKVVIPSVRNKKKESFDINILIYLVGAIAILLFLVVIYLFINKDNLSKSNTVTNNKMTPAKVYTKEVKENKEVIKETIVKVQENTKEIIKEEKPKEIIKEVIKEVIKEKIVTKVVPLDKKNFKSYYNSTKYNSLKCYNFKAGDIFPTSICKNNLVKFLKDNKNAIRFEIVSVIGKSDNIIFNKMQENIKSMDKAFQNRVKEYMNKGLSRERVLETTWYIKDILGEDTILTPTNYYVKSKKNNKGIIIKAYH